MRGEPRRSQRSPGAPLCTCAGRCGRGCLLCRPLLGAEPGCPRRPGPPRSAPLSTAQRYRAAPAPHRSAAQRSAAGTTRGASAAGPPATHLRGSPARRPPVQLSPSSQPGAWTLRLRCWRAAESQVSRRLSSADPLECR